MLKFFVFFVGALVGNLAIDWTVSSLGLNSWEPDESYEFADNEFLSSTEIETFEIATSVPSTNIERNIEVYSELAILNPLKPLYKSKLEFYSKHAEISDEDKKSILKEVESAIDALVLANLEPVKLAKAEAEASHPYLRNSTRYKLLPESVAYLYYEGLDSGSIWDKPGARSFGGSKISDVSFRSGPVRASVIAHAALEGNRNYFYVTVPNVGEGWMGRPYVMKNPQGNEFLMPNPITGENIRTIFSAKRQKTLVDVFKSQPTNFVPSYEDIQWDSRIPVRFRREGYAMYRSALNDGFDKVNSLVSQYQASYNYY
tara:strand:- start:227 stop:1171 length:945 start_codon:yes stop_codon:yes gene_type:complete